MNKTSLETTWVAVKSAGEKWKVDIFIFYLICILCTITVACGLTLGPGYILRIWFLGGTPEADPLYLLCETDIVVCTDNGSNYSPTYKPAVYNMILGIQLFNRVQLHYNRTEGGNSIGWLLLG